MGVCARESVCINALSVRMCVIVRVCECRFVRESLCLRESVYER